MIGYQSCLRLKRLRKTKIKKFLTIRDDCAKLKKLSQSKDETTTKKNKKVVDEQQKIC